MLTREMKDSGVEWIGEIPVQWEMKKVKAFLIEKSEKNHANEEVLSLYRDYGVIPKNSRNDNHNVTSQDTSSYKFVKKNNIVINKMKAWQGSLAVSKYQGIVSPAYYIYEIKYATEIVPEFLHYALRNPLYTQEYKRLSAGLRVGQWDLNKSEFNSLLYPFPSVEIQLKIVEFLNGKIELIDQVIDDTKQSVEELKKYKQSLITEAVTNGLDKNVEMKDSGVDWVGEMPEKWNLAKVNRLFAIKKDIANQSGYDVLSVTQNGLKVKDITYNEGQMAADYSKYQIVQPKDFVMNHMDLLTGWIDTAVQEGVTSPDYRVFYTKDNEIVSNEFYLYVFQICYTNRIFYGLGQGVSNLGRWRLQTDKFLNFYLPLPPIHEQHQIVKYLNGKLLKINSIMEQKKNLLAELEQYKKSLIYEYVTGKKEV
jgi:type I restriction enzyme, S subunit